MDKVCASTDGERPTYRSYFNRGWFWSRRMELMAYDLYARPRLMIALFALLAFGVFFKLFLIAIVAVVVLFHVDTRYGLFPYRSRANWTPRQEEGYRSYVGK